MAHSSEIEKLERRCKENPQGTFFAPLAEAYRKDRQVERALEVLRTGLERHPNHIPGNIVLGRCHLDLGEDEAAETAFRRVLELDRENVIALKALADITERRMRYDEAEQWVRSLLEVDRTNEEARVQLSRLELMRAQTMTPRPPAPEPLLDPAREQAIAEAFGEGLPPAGEPQADAVPMGGVVDGFEATAIRLDPIDDPASSVDRPAASETQAGEFPGAGMPEPSVAPEADEHAREPVELLDVVGEELVLHPSGGSEFQQPNDAETLSVGRAVDGELGADFPDAPGLASVDPEPSAPVPGSGLAAADAPGAGGADSMAPPEWPSDEPATLWNVLAQGASPAGRPSTDELMASGEALAAGAEPSASEAAAESVASVTAGTATPEAAPAEPPA
ncbi:MAG TPA: tetratricopeptide repeat protein, partial [Gemmatimonadales bacterium]|nr:tetratricopeptide repeat protein [Gemmatimonadales bacterium]